MIPILEQIKPETVALLASLASERGLSVDEFLRSLLPINENSQGEIEEKPFYETATPEEWVAAFREWAANHDPNIPPLSLEDVSRESLYEDRW